MEIGCVAGRTLLRKRGHQIHLVGLDEPVFYRRRRPPLAVAALAAALGSWAAASSGGARYELRRCSPWATTPAVSRLRISVGRRPLVVVWTVAPAVGPRGRR